jgi:uracil-DNA glycosylase family 4
MHAFAAERDLGVTILARRQLVPRTLESDLLLLAQGLPKDTQRVTGYPYRERDGLNAAGRRLDGFLSPLGYTIDHTKLGPTYVYSSDLVPWYPGKHPRGRGDRKPSREEVQLCWQFFEREVGLVQPKAVVLLGRWPADLFLRRYASEPLRGRLCDIAGRRFVASVDGHRVVATVAFHPAAIWGKFGQIGARTWERAVGALEPVLEDEFRVER